MESNERINNTFQKVEMFILFVNENYNTLCKTEVETYIVDDHGGGGTTFVSVTHFDGKCIP